MEKKITYSKLKHRRPFNWFKALSGADISIDWGYLHNKSMEWVTCAVGNQCATIHREYNGEPCDSELADLGCNFTTAIHEKNSKRALDILEQIEIRSAYLITLYARFK